MWVLLGLSGQKLGTSYCVFLHNNSVYQRNWCRTEVIFSQGITWPDHRLWGLSPVLLEKLLNSWAAHASESLPVTKTYTHTHTHNRNNLLPPPLPSPKVTYLSVGPNSVLSFHLAFQGLRASFEPRSTVFLI